MGHRLLCVKLLRPQSLEDDGTNALAVKDDFALGYPYDGRRALARQVEFTYIEDFERARYTVDIDEHGLRLPYLRTNEFSATRRKE